MNQNLAIIIITSIEVTTKSGEKNGKPWEIREQEATIETPYMRNPCKISLDKGQGAYPPGSYEFDPLRALKVSDFGSVQLSRGMKLVPVAKAPAKAA